MNFSSCQLTVLVNPAWLNVSTFFGAFCKTNQHNWFVHESTVISNIDYKFRPTPSGHPLGVTGLPLKTGFTEEGYYKICKKNTI